MADIRILIDKFFEGDTSLDEEQAIAHYFMGERIADDLKPLQQMFIDIYKIKTECKMVAQHCGKWHFWRKYSVATAAVITLFVAFGALVQIKQYNYCEANIYGKRYNNHEMVMTEVDKTLSAVAGNGNGVEDELRNVLGQ